MSSQAEALLNHQLSSVELGALLDMGCGDGGFLDELLSVASANEVWGIDVDENALSEAKRYFMKAGPDIPYYFTACSSLAPELPKRNFDSISFQDMLHHLVPGCFSYWPDSVMSAALNAHLEQVDALLSPGGLLICSEFVAEEHNPPARQNRLDIHNLKAEVDVLHNISHSYSLHADYLPSFLSEWAHTRAYRVQCCQIVNAQDAPVLAGRHDRALEQTLEYFDNYVDTLTGAASNDGTLRERHRLFLDKMQSIRSSAMQHGLQAQRRLIFIARKHA